MPKFTTVRFGELDYQQQDVIHLPDGLVGMPRLRNWLLLEMGDDIPMRWLQSLDRADFGVPVSHAWLFHDGYEFDLPASACRRLRNEDPAALTVLVITTVHPGGVLVTGNLMAPLVIDTDTRLGLQLTLDDPRWSLRQEIDYRKFELAVSGQTPDNAAQTVPTASGALRMTAGACEVVGA
jgi:flagellar assembly factor FliW